MSSKTLDFLLEKGIINEEQANEVSVEATKTRRPAELLLVEKGFANDVEVAEAKGHAFNIPFVDLSKISISPQALNIINSDLLRTHKAVPYEDSGATLEIAMVDPFDIPAIQALEQASGNKKLNVHIAGESQIMNIIENRISGAMSSEVTDALEDVEEPATDITEAIEDISAVESSLQNAPVARIVNSILEYGVKSKSSDIHIEPLEKKIRVRYRVSGVMMEKLQLPKKVLPAVVARIKVMADLKIDEKRIPQDGRIPIKVGHRRIDLRVSTLPTVNGEKVVMRLLERTGGVPPLETTGLRGISYKTYTDGIKATNGIILITGPTGSGKTRTLAGTLDRLNEPIVNIITVENPVEIRVPGVNQVQINPESGLTFPIALRAILRQDPDIIMVGEIRDEETARLAVQASLTGHLVLSTLHTNSAAAALPRLLDMGIEAYLLSAVLSLAVAQRLPRRICKHCKEAYIAKEEDIEELNRVLGSIDDFDVVKYLQAKCKANDKSSEELDIKCPIDKGDGEHDFYLYRGKGCDKCEQSGYSGRVGVFEVLKVTENLGRMIIENKSVDEINHQAIKEGMITMIQDGYLKALEGITTMEEVLRVCRD
jgi:type IV pilus assembly protein PilB